MSASQKFAWYNLAVIAVTLFVFFATVPWLGPKRALGGFGLMGFLGFSPIFFLKRRGECVSDERDQLIWQRSIGIGYATFWVAFVAACVGASYLYGSSGAIPVFVVNASVYVGMAIIMTVMSIAILAQYRLGGA